MTHPTGWPRSRRSRPATRVAGDESYVLKVRVASPTKLEDLLAPRIRATANLVQTRTTIVLTTFFEGRPTA